VGKALRRPGTFLAWLRSVGDALCVAAGWLRIHWVGAPPLAVGLTGLLRYPR
jgi:membrane protein YqaA with SNARE-associated domain